MTPTGSAVPGPSADSTVLRAVINKVGPRVLGIVLLVGIALLASTTLYAVFSGRSVDFWGLKIGEGPGPGEAKGGPPDPNQKRCAAREADLQAAQNQSRDLKDQLAGAITSRDLPFWSGGKTKHGDIDGNGERTWQALMRFQQGKRIRNNDNAYEGLCGMKTLARIRAVHKQLADET